MTEKTRKNSQVFTTQKIVKMAILGAMAYILMFIQFPVPFAPPFMKVDLADVPALIGGFALGPVYGVIIEFIKCVLNLSKTMTAGVGELSNFIVGSLFVLVSSVIYRRNKTMKNAVVAMTAGLLVMTAAATISNAFVIFPLYGKIMGISLQGFVDMVSGVNSLVKSYLTLMLLSIVPFNIVKGIIELAVTTLLYKKVSPILKK
ncbi:MAG: ECF transporter S component [Tissierellia bacterium]|nr:ECF transporter S component [Tissierellia bacterium]